MNNFFPTKANIPPKHAVIGIANDKEAKKCVGDMDVQNKVERVFLEGVCIKNLCYNQQKMSIVNTVFESLSMTSLIV